MKIQTKKKNQMRIQSSGDTGRSSSAGTRAAAGVRVSARLLIGGVPGGSRGNERFPRGSYGYAVRSIEDRPVTVLARSSRASRDS